MPNRNKYNCRYGLPQPTRARSENATIFLPAGDTIIGLHKKYVEEMTKIGNVRIAGETSFRKIWHQRMPHLKVLTPRMDVCSICEDLRRKVLKVKKEKPPS